MNTVKEINVENRTNYFFDVMINEKNLDQNKIKINGKSYKNTLIHCINYERTNSVKPLYVIINKMNTYIEESNGNKYLMLVATDESNGIFNN